MQMGWCAEFWEHCDHRCDCGGPLPCEPGDLVNLLPCRCKDADVYSLRACRSGSTEGLGHREKSQARCCTACCCIFCNIDSVLGKSVRQLQPADPEDRVISAFPGPPCSQLPAVVVSRSTSGDRECCTSEGSSDRQARAARSHQHGKACCDAFVHCVSLCRV